MMTNSTEILTTEGGTIAYELHGVGPLVVCLPGMGDLRSSYRYLAPALVEAGYRVALVDLRGHGDSSSTFAEYNDEATARDTIALLEHLGSAVIVGSSMAAGSAAIVAAQRPDLVDGLVLTGPFLRNPKVNPVLAAIMRIATATPLVAATWKAYLPTLFAGRKPDDFAEQSARTIDAIRRPGYARAFSLTTRTTHAPAEAVVDDIHTPTLVVMGELDPDFPKPADEAAWIAGHLDATVLMVPDAGHYPHVQQPEIVSRAVVDFLSSIQRA
jgi:pimeloyl-ACP methyl ester carboxylesterase